MLSSAGLTRNLRKHRLTDHFGLVPTLRRLSEPPFNLSLDTSSAQTCLRSPFLDKIILCVVQTILRELQYYCRIPVPESWNLVGVADEGPSYIERKICNEAEVFTLNEGEIFGEHGYVDCAFPYS